MYGTPHDYQFHFNQIQVVGEINFEEDHKKIYSNVSSPVNVLNRLTSAKSLILEQNIITRKDRSASYNPKINNVNLAIYMCVDDG